jgi:uncharacterized membrane protein HdeD (DUF308 family)
MALRARSAIGDEAEEALSERRTTTLIAGGVALVLLGIAAIANAELATRLSVGLIGVTLAAGGLVALTLTVLGRMGDTVEGWASVSIGVMSLAAGAVILAKPAPSAALLTAAAAFLLLGTGGQLIAVAIVRGVAGRGLLLVSGLASSVLGVFVLARWPDAGTRVIGLYVGLQLAMDGAILLALGIERRRRP